MNHIRWTGSLRREFHHVKIAHDEDGGYEPTLVILSHTKLGRSFMIPLNSFYKYLDPSTYKKDEKYKKQDWWDFNEIAAKAKRTSLGQSESGLLCIRPSQKEMREAFEDIKACQFAYAFNKATHISLCVAFNIYKLMDMFEITVSPQAAAQLLLWIQDGLDELRSMPPCPEKDHETAVGEGTVKIDGKSFTSEIKVSETEIVETAGRN